MPGKLPGLKALNDPRLIIIVILLIGGIIFAAGLRQQTRNVQGSACGPYRNDRIIAVGNQKIKAEVVQSPADRQHGLSGRPCIGSDQAMLFVYGKPGHYSFWMKDMKFPIDIIWMGSDHKVVGVERDVKPGTYPDSFVNKDKLAQYVLEIQSGRSTNLGISIGTPVNF